MIQVFISATVLLLVVAKSGFDYALIYELLFFFFFKVYSNRILSDIYCKIRTTVIK